MAGARSGGFTPIPQEERISEQQQQQRRRLGDFRSHVQQVLRQSTALQEKGQDSVRVSPALSDTTLVCGDYLDVPLRRHEETNRGQYVEYCAGYYGPEAAGLSPMSSARAGIGLEVHSAPVIAHMASEVLLVDDDDWHGTNCCDSEGRSEEEEVKHENRNFKPLSLKGKFLTVLFFSLIVLVVLAELAIQLLPDDSGINPFSQASEHNENIHPRFQFGTKAGTLSKFGHFKRQNDTAPVITVSTSTETTSHTVPESTPSSSSLTSQTITVPPTEGGTTTDFSTGPTDIPPTNTEPVIPPSSESQLSSISSTINVPAPPLPPPGNNPLPSITSSESLSPPSTSLVPPPPLTSIISEIGTSETQEPTSSRPGHPDHSGQPPILDPPHPKPTSSEDTSLSPPSPSFSLPTAPNPDPPANTKPTHTDSTTTVSTQPPPPPPSPPSPTSSRITEPSRTSTSPTSPPLSTLTESYGTTIESTGTTSPLPASSSKAQSSSTTTIAQSTGGGPNSSLTQTAVIPSSSLESESTPTKSSTTDGGTGLSSQTSSSTTSDSEVVTSPPSNTMPGSIPILTQEPPLPVPETIETELPEPFTTITKTSEEPPPPPKTTTITTSTTLDDLVFMTTFVQVIKAGFKNPIGDYVFTYTDSQGKPTRTETILAQASARTDVLKDPQGHPTKTMTVAVLRPPSKTTLTDYQGRATLTLDYYIGLSTEVLYDPAGHPTATRTSMVTETPIITTLFDEHGVPTLTKTEFAPLSLTTTVFATPTPEATPEATPVAQGKKELKIVPISDGRYFLGLMLPTFIAIVMSIPIRIVDQSARLYYPFHELTSTRGALARDSLCFETASIWNLRARVRSLLNGEYLLTLTGLLVLGSVVMVPLSSEAVRIILSGPSCATPSDVSSTCTMALAVRLVPSQVAVGLLILMLTIVGLTAIVLRKWETGLSWNPWSLVRMGHLAANNEIRTLLLRRMREKGGSITNKDMDKSLAKKVFILTDWEENGYSKYSILIRNETSLRKDGKPVRRKANRHKGKGSSMPFFILTWTGRLLFLALLCGVMIGLLVYTIAGDGKDYTQYMEGKWRVVRFIFTTISVLISLIWGSFFYGESNKPCYVPISGMFLLTKFISRRVS
ncbi:hypothetical protein Daesc_003300 [Daldinia eschscholtzii]|uniref:Uncharacterized protein n=1 Tax=Daldinia eschscholtzii TaxID=292717 RepID=A0AAX6MTC8_9PEZI